MSARRIVSAANKVGRRGSSPRAGRPGHNRPRRRAGRTDPDPCSGGRVRSHAGDLFAMKGVQPSTSSCRTCRACRSTSTWCTDRGSRRARTRSRQSRQNWPRFQGASSPLDLPTRRARKNSDEDTRLLVENDTSQVKIEVSVVFRGMLLLVERKPLNPKSRDLFGFEFEVPTLARDELYAGKLVAALDRQHPRDLFDVWQLYESGGLTDGHGRVLRALPGRSQPSAARGPVRTRQEHRPRLTACVRRHDAVAVLAGHATRRTTAYLTRPVSSPHGAARTVPGRSRTDRARVGAGAVSARVAVACPALEARQPADIQGTKTCRLLGPRRSACPQTTADQWAAPIGALKG